MKTPKEKAQELFDKFKPIAHANLFSFREESHTSNSKKGALIVVDEIIETTISKIDSDYWNEVKSEIEKF